MATIKRLDATLTGSDVKEFTYRIIHTPGYLPDCLCDVKSVTDIFIRMVNTAPDIVGVYDGAGKLGGVFFLGDIVPGHEATLFSWFWGKCFTPDTAREIKEYIDENAGVLGLARVEARTADDKKHGKLLELLGLKLEGRFKNAYKSGGKCRALFQYRKLYPKFE